MKTQFGNREGWGGMLMMSHKLDKDHWAENSICAGHKKEAVSNYREFLKKRATWYGSSLSPSRYKNDKEKTTLSHEHKNKLLFVKLLKCKE